LTIAAERDGWSVLGFPPWHQWPAAGNPRALGPVRKHWKPFEPGAEYTKRQVAGWCWTDNSSVRSAWNALSDDARFRCTLSGAVFKFTLIVAHDPRVPAATARELMAKLQGKGLSYREVARRTGVSPDTAARAAQGIGQVRLSTVLLLEELAGSLNGKKRR
jgi:hypothetical protein